MKDIQSFINSLRTEYSKQDLNEKSIASDPFKQFQLWFEEAAITKITDSNAFTLSTVSADSKPSSRIVLLRGFDKDGFVFFTNYESKKGHDISENPNVAMNFFWPDLEKQIRIEGTVAKISNEKSDAYFNSRPRESQLGAWVSNQSTDIENREVLSQREKELNEYYLNASIPRPEHWGGYIITPLRFEFWQGRPSRLHDRIVYEPDKSGNWHIKRIAP